ncbi:hypothetical protein Poly30_11460 [Planctomycetes bacterium Poly30]|uniref:Uncharacterized protein n=1 Tax=Saltatorellus ferox TaxID=2528018 RepID=A0A518ENI1_9BACT|nr:hypothetical protein Poly30_11460 [Planctomycetes bacterium Poly30]
MRGLRLGDGGLGGQRTGNVPTDLTDPALNVAGYFGCAVSRSEPP